jgi:hypothetical protein
MEPGDWTKRNTGDDDKADQIPGKVPVPVWRLAATLGHMSSRYVRFHVSGGLT